MRLPRFAPNPAKRGTVQGFARNDSSVYVHLSACAEDHRLCLWMNAQNVAEYFMHPSMTASADFAVGG
jgi:hypothetical protein